MKYVITSDIHLGHKNTPTHQIIRSFHTSILTPANTDADILFVAGDLFDHLLYLNTVEAQQIIQFFHELLNYCHHNDIQLRVLEGTPSHDWYQSEMLVKLNEVRKNKVDLLYVKILDIEYNARYSKYILYIPDKWCSSQQELERQVNAKLAEHGVRSVDIAILHGAFKYQADHPTTAFMYDEPYFLNLVRGFIHIGHYHKHSTLDRIIAGGSLDRLAHGEEDPKGYVVVQDTSYTFVHNPNAYTYRTINVTPSVDLTKLDKLVYKSKPGSHIRLHVSDAHPLSQSFKDLKLRYPDYHLKKLSKDKAPDSTDATYILNDDLLEVSEHLITESNIYDTLLRLVETKHSLTAKEQSKLRSYASVFKQPTPQEHHP